MKVRWKITMPIFLLCFSLIPLPPLLRGYGSKPWTKKKSSESKGYILQAVRAKTPPKIDGFLEAEIWMAVSAATNFVQKQPEEGMPATEDTEVKMLYDAENLYIGIMCYDSEPEKIIANEKRRDSSNIYDNDHFQIMLDTFHDRRNGYIFVINPLGAKLDLQVRKEGKREGGWHIPNPNINISWDGDWNFGPDNCSQIYVFI